MGLLGRDGAEAVRLEESDEHATGSTTPEGMTLYRVRPYKETPGFDAATAFVRGLTTDRGERVTVEPWFDDARIKFIVGAPNRGDVVDVVDSHFPNSVIEAAEGAFPAAEPGEYVAGARLELAKDCAYPLRHPESRGEGFDVDPYKDLLPKLTGTDDERAMFQVVLRPVGAGWYKRGVMGADTGKIAASRGEGRVVGQRNPEVVHTDADSDIETDMERQRGRPAFQVAVRTFAVAPDAVTAERRVETIANALRAEYAHLSDQELTPTYLQGARLRRGLEAAVRRTVPCRSRVTRWLRGPSSVLTDREVAGLAHLPNADINAPDVDWSRMESGAGTPPDAPQHDPDALEVGR